MPWVIDKFVTVQGTAFSIPTLSVFLIPNKHSFLDVKPWQLNKAPYLTELTELNLVEPKKWWFFQKSCKKNWRNFLSIAMEELGGGMEGINFSGQLFFLPVGFASSWPSLPTCQDLLFLPCSAWSGPDFFIPLVTGNCSPFPTIHTALQAVSQLFG